MLQTLVYVIVIFAPFVNCRTYLVTTSRQLQDSLRAVNPGDTIQLRDGYYTANFVASRVGQPNAPIRLIGSQRAILSNNGGVGLYVTGQYWWIRGFSIQNTRIGIILYGARNNVIERLTIRNTEEEGIIVQRNSVNNMLRYISVARTGLRSRDYGYGIAIGSDSTAYNDNSYYQNNNNYNNDRNLNSGYDNNRNLNPGYDNNNNGYNTRYDGNYNQNGRSNVDRSDGNSILYNRFATGSPAEAIHIYEGTCCGTIIGNYFDGRTYSNGFTTDNNNLNQCWVSVNGNQYRIESNLGRYSGLDGFQVLMISGANDNNVNDGNIYYSPSNTNDNNNLKSDLNQNVQTQQLSRNSDSGYYDNSYNSFDTDIAGGCNNVFRRNRCELNNLNGYCIRVVNPNRCRITIYSDNSVNRGSVTNVAVTNL